MYGAGAGTQCATGLDEVRGVAVATVRNEGGKVCIEGVRKVSWDTGEMCEFASSLLSAMLCLGEDVSYPYIVGTSGVAFRFTLTRGECEFGDYSIRNVAPDSHEPVRRVFRALGYECLLHDKGAKADDAARIMASIARGASARSHPRARNTSQRVSPPETAGWSPICTNEFVPTAEPNPNLLHANPRASTWCGCCERRRRSPSQRARHPCEHEAGGEAQLPARLEEIGLGRADSDRHAVGDRGGRPREGPFQEWTFQPLSTVHGEELHSNVCRLGRGFLNVRPQPHPAPAVDHREPRPVLRWKQRAHGPLQHAGEPARSKRRRALRVPTGIVDRQSPRVVPAPRLERALLGEGRRLGHSRADEQHPVHPFEGFESKGLVELAGWFVVFADVQQGVARAGPGPSGHIASTRARAYPRRRCSLPTIKVLMYHASRRGSAITAPTGLPPTIPVRTKVIGRGSSRWSG